MRRPANCAVRSLGPILFTRADTQNLTKEGQVICLKTDLGGDLVARGDHLARNYGAVALKVRKLQVKLALLLVQRCEVADHLIALIAARLVLSTGSCSDAGNRAGQAIPGRGICRLGSAQVH